MTKEGMIHHADDTAHEGLQELRERLDQTSVSDSTIDHLREREEEKARYEERRFRKRIGIATRNLLLWIAGALGTVATVYDVIVHLGGRK